MAEGIVIGVDASRADRGLAQFDKRLNTTLQTLDRFDKRAGQVFSRLDQVAGRTDFSKLSAQVNGLARASVGLDKVAGSAEKLRGAIERLSGSSNLAKVSRDLNAVAGSVQRVQAAARGLSRTTQSIEGLTSALTGRRFNVTGIERMAASLRSLSGVKVDPRLAPQVGQISNAMAAFRAPSRAAVTNTTAFLKALQTSVDPNVVRTISGLATASNAFQGPRTQAVNQLQRLIATANGASIAQINSLASAMTKLSAANARFAGTGPAAAATMRAAQRGMMNPAQVAQPRAQTPRPAGGGRGPQGYGGTETMLYGPLGGFSQMQGGATGLLGVATLAGSATKIMEEYNRTISTTALLTNELGEKSAAEAQFARLRQLANQTGQSFANLADTTPSLTIAMRANGATLAETNEVIQGVSTAMTALGRNPQQVERAMRAIEQSFSKGRVGMEELRQQLGDALPGAFGVFAKALGKTEAELSMMIQRNEFIDPKTFIQMGRLLQQQFAPALGEQMQTSQRQMTLLGNSFSKLMSDLGAAGADRGLADMFRAISEAINSISAERIAAIGQVLGTVFRGIGQAAGFVVRNIEVLAAALGAISFAAIMAAGIALFGMFTTMFSLVGRLAGGIMGLAGANTVAAGSNAALTASSVAATTALNAQAAASARVVQGGAGAAVAQIATNMAAGASAAATGANVASTAASMWGRLGSVFTTLGRALLGFTKVAGWVAVAIAALGIAFPSVSQAIDGVIPGFDKFASTARVIFGDGINLVKTYGGAMISSIGGAITWSISQFTDFFSWLSGKFGWLGSAMAKITPGASTVTPGGVTDETDTSTIGSARRMMRYLSGTGGGYIQDAARRAETNRVEAMINSASDSPLGANSGSFGQTGRDAQMQIMADKFAQEEARRQANRRLSGSEILQRGGQTAADFLKLDPIAEANREYEKLAKTLQQLLDLARVNPNDDLVKQLGGVEGITQRMQRAEAQSRDARNPRRAQNEADAQELRLLDMTVEARRREEEAIRRIKQLKDAGVAVSAQEEAVIRQTVTYMDQLREAREFMRGELIQLDPLKQANKELEEFLRKLNLAKSVGGLSAEDAADAERRYRAQNAARLDPTGARIAELQGQTRSAVRERQLRGLAGGERAFQMALEREMDNIAKARFGTTNTDGLSEAQRAELEGERRRLEPALRANMQAAGSALYESRVAEMREELKLAGLTTEQRQLEMQVLQKVREIEAATGQALDPAKIAEIRALVTQMDAMNKGGVTGIQQWASGVKSLGSALNDVEKNALNSLSDALTDLVTDGTADFQKLGKSLLREINKAIIQSMLADLFRSTGGLGGFSLAGIFGVGGGTSGTPPSMFSGIFGGAAAAASPPPAAGAAAAAVAPPPAAGAGTSILTPFGSQGLLGGMFSRGSGAGGGAPAGIFGAFGNISRAQAAGAASAPQVTAPAPQVAAPAPQIAPPAATTGPTMTAPMPPMRPEQVFGPVAGAMRAPQQIVPPAANENDIMGGLYQAPAAPLTTFQAPVPLPRPADLGAVTQQLPAMTGNVMNLSPKEIIDLKKTLSTEWVTSAGEPQAAGIVDTILNRRASGRWGQDVRSVVNSYNQFSDINGPPSRRHGRTDVDQLPDSILQSGRGLRSSQFVDRYLAQRAAGAPSSVGNHLNYANPYFSDRKNLEWINKLEGPVFGRGNAIHRHGTTSDLQSWRPQPYQVRLPGQQAPATASPATPPMPGNQMDAMGAAQQQVAQQYQQQMGGAIQTSASSLSQAGTQTAQTMTTSMQSAVQQTAQVLPQQVAPAMTGAITPGIQGVGDIMQSTAQAQMGQGGFWQSMMGGMGGGGGGVGGLFSMLFGGFKYGGFSDGPAPQTVSASPSEFRNAPHFAKGTPRVGGSMSGTPSILHPNEAVIPLTGGRKVPVELGNDNQSNDNQRGGGTVINMVVNTKDADSFKRSEKQIRAKQSAALHRANQYNN